MRSRAKLKKWVDDALKDGWTKGPEKRHKHARATQFDMHKDIYRAHVWFGPTAENCSVKLYGPNGDYEPWQCGNGGGYDFAAFVEACIGCNKCRTPNVPLRKYGFNSLCEAHPQTERKYIGTAKLEFRHVHGRLKKNAVKEYRVLCDIDGKDVLSYYEPYNGCSKKMAYAASSAAFFALSCGGYKVEQVEKHTTWNGEEIKK
jgi:hypothetical protein